jgi:flagellar transcriptional activator FlhD
MNSEREVLDSIREVNLTYLLLVQRLLREDKATGMFRLGLSATLADILKDLSLAQIVKMAATGQLLCLFRLNDHAALRALTQSAKHADVAPTHAAILLAGQSAEQLA